MHLAQWALATILLLIAFWTIRRTTQFKQSQDDLIRSLPAGPSQRWFRVNVARPEYFARRIKLLGFQARGVLIDEGPLVRLLAIYPDGARLDQAYPKASKEERLGRMMLANVLLMTARGVPTIYYGDEQGFVSDGGDQAAREDMFASQVASYNDNVLIGTSSTTASAKPVSCTFLLKRFIMNKNISFN